MSTIVSSALHGSRVKYIAVVYACGHTVSLKVSPTISADYICEIRREAKVSPCQVCRTSAARRPVMASKPAVDSLKSPAIAKRDHPAAAHKGA